MANAYDDLISQSAVGTTYKGRPAGTIAPVGVYSFNGNKIITTSGGGMLLAHSARHAERALHLATQARDPAPHYQHSQIGFNYRMSNVLAAIGRGQLRVLDARVAARRHNFAFYQQVIPGLFFFLGVVPPDQDPEQVAPNHSPRFFADERALVTGVRALAQLACDHLETGA